MPNKFLKNSCFKNKTKKPKVIHKFITLPGRLTGYSFGNSESKSKVHKGK